MYSPEMSQYISSIKPDVTPDQEVAIRNLIRLKSQTELYDQLITDFTNNGSKLSELEKILAYVPLSLMLLNLSIY